MSDNTKPQKPPQKPESGKPLTEERGLPPVRETPPMPPVKPPKQKK